MKGKIFRKGLVIGIIFLFIGVGIQPAFANEISHIRTSENIEDCNCQVADNFNVVRAEKLLDRFEGYTKILLFLSRKGTEITEKCQDLSDGINTIIDKYKELKTESFKDDYPIICAILESIYLSLIKSIDYIWILYDKFEDSNPNFASILKLLICALILFEDAFYIRGEKYGCDFYFQGSLSQLYSITKEQNIISLKNSLFRIYFPIELPILISDSNHWS